VRAITPKRFFRSPDPGAVDQTAQGSKCAGGFDSGTAVGFVSDVAAHEFGRIADFPGCCLTGF
jgi:hypothetical protein